MTTTAHELRRAAIRSVLPAITTTELDSAITATDKFDAAGFRVFIQSLQKETATATNKSLEVLKATLTSQGVRRLTTKAIQGIAKDVEPLIAREAISKALEASVVVAKTSADITFELLQAKYGKKNV